jgi:hypothetical protein
MNYPSELKLRVGPRYLNLLNTMYKSFGTAQLFLFGNDVGCGTAVLELPLRPITLKDERYIYQHGVLRSNQVVLELSIVAPRYDITW